MVGNFFRFNVDLTVMVIFFFLPNSLYAGQEGRTAIEIEILDVSRCSFFWLNQGQFPCK